MNFDPVSREDDIMNFGALNYDAAQMAIILDMEKEEVEALMNTNEDFARIYNKGATMAKYLLDKKLFQIALSGDLKALELFRYEMKQARKK